MNKGWSSFEDNMNIVKQMKDLKVKQLNNRMFRLD